MAKSSSQSFCFALCRNDLKVIKNSGDEIANVSMIVDAQYASFVGHTYRENLSGGTGDQSKRLRKIGGSDITRWVA